MDINIFVTLLAIYNNNRPEKRCDIMDYCEKYILDTKNLPDFNKLIPSGSVTKGRKKLEWSFTTSTKSKYVDVVSRGKYKITTDGKHYVEDTIYQNVYLEEYSGLFTDYALRLMKKIFAKKEQDILERAAAIVHATVIYPDLNE